jgi:uncharacterized membrane protein
MMDTAEAVLGFLFIAFMFYLAASQGVIFFVILLVFLVMFMSITPK